MGVFLNKVKNVEVALAYFFDHFLIAVYFFVVHLYGGDRQDLITGVFLAVKDDSVHRKS